LYEVDRGKKDKIEAESGILLVRKVAMVQAVGGGDDRINATCFGQRGVRLQPYLTLHWRSYTMFYPPRADRDRDRDEDRGEGSSRITSPLMEGEVGSEELQETEPVEQELSQVK
jgi:hypothetical protein